MKEILEHNDQYRFGPKEMIGFANWAQKNGWQVHSPHLKDWIEIEMIHEIFYDEWSETNVKETAEQFIKKCNVMPGVHALEGGVMELSSLLVDFIKYLNDGKCKKCYHSFSDDFPTPEDYEK